LLFVCVSHPVYAASTLRILGIYLNEDETAILYDTEEEKRIILISSKELLYDIYDISSDKEWIIFSYKPAKSSSGRVFEILSLIHVQTRSVVPNSVLGDTPVRFLKEAEGETVKIYGNKSVFLNDLIIKKHTFSPIPVNLD
jgi:hypothetical protein